MMDDAVVAPLPLLSSYPIGAGGDWSLPGVSALQLDSVLGENAATIRRQPEVTG